MATRQAPYRWRVKREPLNYYSPTTGRRFPWLIFRPGERLADHWAATQPEAFAIALALATAYPKED